MALHQTELIAAWTCGARHACRVNILGSVAPSTHGQHSRFYMSLNKHVTALVLQCLVTIFQPEVERVLTYSTQVKVLLL